MIGLNDIYLDDVDGGVCPQDIVEQELMKSYMGTESFSEKRRADLI